MTTQQKKVLVAVVGASGGVGSATVKAALAAGHQVRVLARSRTKLCAVLGDDVVAQLDAVVLAAVKLVPSSELKPAKKAALAREDVAVAMARLIDPAVFAAWAGKGVTVVVP